MDATEKANQAPAARVTVCIPTRNRAAYLRQSVASVLGQTYRDLVLVVSDNASTDETPAVVAGVGDPRLRSQRPETDIGLLGNFNRCLEGLETEFVVILADDEVLYPEHLEESVRFLDAHPTAGMAHCAFDVVGPGGELVAQDVNWCGAGSENRLDAGEDFIRATIGGWSLVAASTAVIRTAALPEGGFLPEDFPPADLGLWLRLALDWDIGFLATPLAAYRIHPGSHSAVYGTYTAGGYIDSVEHLLKGEEIKLRFLAENRERFADHAALAAVARAYTRRALVNRVARLTEDDRRLPKTARLLAQAVRVRPLIALDAQAWRLLAGAAVGPRIMSRVRARRAARSSTQAVAP
jgi:glycosyltransferase involved in cell wall biosynthesis